jgi:hypothetical protein
MSQRNPDLSAGVYVAAMSGVVLLCLVGALVLPASLLLNKWLADNVCNPEQTHAPF